MTNGIANGHNTSPVISVSKKKKMSMFSRNGYVNNEVSAIAIVKCTAKII